MDLVQRVKGILLTPETEWLVIAKEPGTPGYLFPQYMAYLAAIPPIARVIGNSVIGIATQNGVYRVPLLTGLLGAVIAYVLSFVVVYLIAIIVDQLAPRFGGVKDFAGALKVTVYSFTPYWIAGILQLAAGLRFVAYVVAFFGAYLAWLGLTRLMRPKPDQAVIYVAISVGCAIVVIVAVTLIEAAFLP
jgi:Yip1 domain